MLDLGLRLARPIDQAGDFGGGRCGLVADDDGFMLAHSKLLAAANIAAFDM
jgi:hypothetical protein